MGIGGKQYSVRLSQERMRVRYAAGHSQQINVALLDYRKGWNWRQRSHCHPRGSVGVDQGRSAFFGALPLPKVEDMGCVVLIKSFVGQDMEDGHVRACRNSNLEVGGGKRKSVP